MKENKIFHKIEAGKKYRVWKKTYNDKDFYSIQVTQKNYDNQVDKYYVDLQFKKGVDLPNQTDIIIKEAYENYRKNKADEYHPITYYMITNFEIVENEERAKQNAYDEFRNNLDDNEVEIGDDFLD